MGKLTFVNLEATIFVIVEENLLLVLLCDDHNVFTQGLQKLKKKAKKQICEKSETWLWSCEIYQIQKGKKKKTKKKPTVRTCFGQTQIPQTHCISPAQFLFISFKNLLFQHTSLKSQHGFFKLFTLVH